jgi:hypothetical protein
MFKISKWVPLLAPFSCSGDSNCNIFCLMLKIVLLTCPHSCSHVNCSFKARIDPLLSISYILNTIYWFIFFLVVQRFAKISCVGGVTVYHVGTLM